MTEIIKSVIATLGTAGIVLLIAWYWVQKYLNKRIDSYFHSIESRVAGAIETSFSLRKIRLQKTAELLPQLQKLASECRNAMQEFLRTAQQRDFETFASSREAFIDCLYGSQILLLPNTYDCGHRLKRAFDSVFIFVGESTDVHSESSRTAIQSARTNVDNAYEELKRLLRSDLVACEKVDT